MTLIRILILLLLCSPAWGATEFVFPTAGSGFDTGDHDDIDECDTAPTCTPDDGTLMSTNKKGETMTGGTFSDLVTADADDTYNSVTVFLRSDMTGTAGNETVDLRVTDGTDLTTISGNNGTPATDDSGAITVYNSFAEINALTFEVEAIANGAESVTLWRAQTVYISVDYTAVEGASQVFYVTWLEKWRDYVEDRIYSIFLALVSE